MTRPRDWLQFGAGVLWLVIAIIDFLNRSSAETGILGQYGWLVWLLGSAAFFISAYRKPVEKPE